MDILIRYGNKFQQDKNSGGGLFGELAPIEIAKPDIPRCEEWPGLYKLNREKELIGMYISAHPLDSYKYEIKNFCNVSLSQLKELKPLMGTQIIAAGIVSSVREDVGKNGKPWGKIVLEDYTDTHEFAFFGKDYESFQNYIKQGISILIRGVVQEHPFRKGEIEAKIRTINLLGNVRDEMVKALSLSMPLQAVTHKRINELEELALSNKGNVPMRFMVVDPESGYYVNMFSRGLRVSITTEFMETLENYSNLEWKWIKD